MLSVVIKFIMLTIFLLIVIVLIVIMLSVGLWSVILLIVIMLNVLAPSRDISDDIHNLTLYADWHARYLQGIS